MTLLKVLLFVLVSSLGYINCALVDTLQKCSLKDEKCHIEMFTNVLHTLGEHGAKELNIPRIDPLSIANVDASIPNILNLVFIKGTIKGAKDCVVNKWHLDMERLRATLHLTCDITVQGQYNVKSTADVLKNLIGDVHGKGNGKVDLEQLALQISFPFSIEKRGDKFYFTSELKKFKYSFKIKKVTFAADKLYQGEKESSKDIIKLINENWSVLLEAFGEHFLKLAMEFVHPFVLGFFNNVSAESYLSDDLTPYLKN